MSILCSEIRYNRLGGTERNMKRDSYECSAEMGSVTEAMKAQRVLAAAAIPTEVIKIEGTRRRGCVFGIGFSCSQQNNVRAVLSSARINPRAWNAGYDLS